MVSFAKEMDVLLVDDEEESLTGLSQLMSRYFKSVSVAKNGKEAFDIFRAGSFDLVITDIVMPRMTGIELIGAIRKEDYDQCIIAISSHDQIDYLHELIDLSTDGFLVKPLKHDLLMKMLYRVTKQIYERKMMVEFQAKLEESYIELMEKKEALEKALNEAKTAQNKNIALSESHKEDAMRIDHEQLEYLSHKLDEMSAEEFHNMYPLDLEAKNDILERSEEQMDIVINRLENTPSHENMMEVGHLFKELSQIIILIPEFGNLGHGLGNMAELLTKMDQEQKDKIGQISDWLFNITDSLKQWRISVFVDKKAQNIHYMDNSLITDCLMIESVITGKHIQKDDDNDLELF